MVFSDQAFVFFFLPISIALGLLAIRLKFFAPMALFLGLSFFYWSSGLYVLLLVVSITLNYFGGLAVERWHRRSTIALVIAFNLAILVYYKYAGLLLGTVGYLGSDTVRTFATSIVLPIGISFFTFQGISYLVDVWRRDIRAERSFVYFAAYKAFYPQLIAGPIVRYRDVVDDFHDPKPSTSQFAAGAARFMVGLLKKVLIADSIAPIADAAFSLNGADIGFASAWIGAIAFSLQIYFDFSGYSDMAIGIAMMFGVRFNENFNHPYAATTVTEFWRRWHISLSSWFRDYVYIPLGGNRKGGARTYLNLLIVFAATGIWHGAAWTFLLWGLYHGAFMIGERLLLKDRKLVGGPVRLLYLLPVVIVGWTLFRAPDLAVFGIFVQHMALPLANGAFVLPPELGLALTPAAAGVLIFAAVASVLQPEYRPLGVIVSTTNTLVGGSVRLAFVGSAGILAMVLVVPNAFSPFLYFRF